MKGLKRLEAATTEYFVPTTIGIVVVVVGAFAIIVSTGLAGLDPVNKFVDATFKTAATLIGATWALNRYFVGRTDAVQLRVDPILDVVPAEAFERRDFGLLIYRLDIVNTGKSLIPVYHQFLEIDAISVSHRGAEYNTLIRWPQEGLHEGGPIEPGSWSAINNAHHIPSDVKAVRVYLEIRMKNGAKWTWHRSFVLSPASHEE